MSDSVSECDRCADKLVSYCRQQRHHLRRLQRGRHRCFQRNHYLYKSISPHYWLKRQRTNTPEQRGRGRKLLCSFYRNLFQQQKQSQQHQKQSQQQRREQHQQQQQQYQQQQQQQYQQQQQNINLDPLGLL